MGEDFILKKRNEDMKRDWMIEGVRFLATCGIAIYHFEWIYLGTPIYFQHFYILVEFFFVLSGFFLAKNILENKNDSFYMPFKYVKKEAVKLWKPYIVAFVFSFIVYCLINDIKGWKNIIVTLFAAKWEIFFLQLSGFDMNAPIINGVTAYIPALLFSSLIIYYLIKKHYMLFVNIVIPVIPIFIYAHIINTYGNLSQWTAFENWYTIGVFRGLAGTLIGAGGYIYGERMHSKNVCREVQCEFSHYVLGIISVLAILGLVFVRNHLSFVDMIIYPYIFGIVLYIIFFREKREVPAIIESVFLKCGKISYMIFLIHYGLCYLFQKYYSGHQYSVTAIYYMLIVTIMAIIMNRFLHIVERNNIRSRNRDDRENGK